MKPRSPGEDPPVRRELPEPQEWLERYGDVLYRYALSRLRRPQDAEEAVQDTLLAALQARQEFRGQSQPQTWLLGIMRHKVLSRLRAAAREGPATDLGDVDDVGAWFNSHGHWRKKTVRWGDPAELAERQDFWGVVHRCLAALPAGMAAAFTLRTLDGRDSAEVCLELAISPANLWVLLHRARLRLLRCLQIHWFDAEGQP
jgi:RNA polymerase sigma-70 factor (TIGR02943 family)